MPNAALQNIALNGYEISGGQAAGYQEPFLLLRLEAKPSSKTSFKIEYAFDDQLDGIIKSNKNEPVDGIITPYSKRVSIYRIFQFQAQTITTKGTFKIIAGGGVNWYRLSPLTLWNYEYRDDLFERYPWEPEGKAMSRYNSFYEVQNVARDARWGNTGTQGFILEANSLPLGFNAVILYGKTDNSGGFQSYVNGIPKNMLSGRISKTLGAQQIALNYFSQFGYYDGTALYKIDQNIASAEWKRNFKVFKVFLEAGAGRYAENGTLTSANYYHYFGRSTSSSDTAASFINPWAPCANLQIDIDKNIFPLSAQFFYINKSVVNVNSQVLNTSNSHAMGTPSNVNSPYDVTTLRGAVTDVGQMANNRMGTSLKYENTFKKLKLMMGTGVSQEIENLYKTYTSSSYNMPNNFASFLGYAQSFNSITFQHRANQFTRSRFGYYMNNVGPYNKVINMYRRSFETVAITDTNVNYRKGYNSIDFNWKYKFLIGKRDLIISNYYNYSSVQDHLSPFPVFSNKAFLRYFYTELNTFFSLHSKLTLIAFVSFERVMGNMRTALADADGKLITDPTSGIAVYNANGKPIDQFGHGYGFGVDYDFAPRAGIYLRSRWFDHRDKNFISDQFSGIESSLELKIFF